MRPVLCLFEGVATGAADGYGRMADRPACTLLHLGPGYGNGVANLHNARRAYTPIVNVIGDHATYHRQYDAPLNSDIATLVKPNSLWAKSADSPDTVAGLANGTHSFKVRAIDPVSGYYDVTPAARSFSVSVAGGDGGGGGGAGGGDADTTAPQTTIDKGPSPGASPAQK